MGPLTDSEWRQIAEAQKGEMVRQVERLTRDVMRLQGEVADCRRAITALTASVMRGGCDGK
jgi:hypothetical protein